MVLSRRFVEHLIRSRRARALRRFFRLSRVSDEKFFLTALLNDDALRHSWLRLQVRCR